MGLKYRDKTPEVCAIQLFIKPNYFDDAAVSIINCTDICLDHYCFIDSYCISSITNADFSFAGYENYYFENFAVNLDGISLEYANFDAMSLNKVAMA